MTDTLSNLNYSVEINALVTCKLVNLENEKSWLNIWLVLDQSMNTRNLQLLFNLPSAICHLYSIKMVGLYLFYFYIYLNLQVQTLC